LPDEAGLGDGVGTLVEVVTGVEVGSAGAGEGEAAGVGEGEGEGEGAIFLIFAGEVAGEDEDEGGVSGDGAVYAGWDELDGVTEDSFSSHPSSGALHPRLVRTLRDS
jgi:hypothetical protein